jgi:hypothetical protein
LLNRSFSLPNDLKRIPLKTKIAVRAEPTRALSKGIEVNMEIIINVIAPVARLNGSQVLIAEWVLITLSLHQSLSQFIDYTWFAMIIPPLGVIWNL